ncbi:DNA cytosine methyltransferase [bacterium]|nr:DNA cytosine methyltransferase [bacterium]
MKKLKVVDLFAGCGGFSLGFMQAGYSVVAAFDNWGPAIDIYKKNFKHDIINLDLSNIESHKKILEYKMDIIVGGPPCQDFSSAGKRNEELGRADLTVVYAQIVSKVKPKYFLMENVDRIVKSCRLKEAVNIFKNSGYALSYQMLEASYFGIPQIRKRFFMFGELDGKDHVLEYYFEKNKSKKPTTVRDYFRNNLDIEHYYRHPRNYNRRAVFSVGEPSPTIRGVNRPIPKGYNGHVNDSSPINEKIRPLTTVERAIIQTFPRDFVWEGKKTDLEQMIGNAVPVKLARFVANCITEYIGDKKSGKTFNRPAVQLSLG